MSQWYCRRSGRTHGPLSASQIKELAARGNIHPGDELRKGVDGGWRRARDVPGIVFRCAAEVGSGDYKEAYQCLIQGRIYGLFTTGELLALARRGKLRRGDAVRRRGNSSWTPVTGVPKLVRAADSCASKEPDSTLASHKFQKAGGPAGLRAVTRRRPSIRRDYRQLNSILFCAFAILPFMLPRFGPPSTTLAIVLAAMAGFLTCIAATYALLRPPESSVRLIVATFLSTVIGAGLLLTVDVLTVQKTETQMRKSSSASASNDYAGLPSEVNMEESERQNGLTHLGITLALTILGIGLVEEAVKLIPLAAIVTFVTPAPTASLIAFLACVSGITFGIVEGAIHALVRYDSEPLFLSSLLVRFIGSPLIHATLCWWAAGFLMKFARDFSFQGPKRLAAFPAAVLSAAIPHGIYDALLFNNRPGFAGALIVTMILAVVDGPFRPSSQLDPLPAEPQLV